MEEPIEIKGFNLLVSYRWGSFGRARAEISRLLKTMGDETPVIERTCARGVARVKTSLDPREAVKRLRELHRESPSSVYFTMKWAPADLWCGTEMGDMKEALSTLRSKILPGERWAMEVEKRRSTRYHKAEVIEGLAPLIDEKVDLSKPDKIVRVEIICDEVSISVVKPEEIFSTGKTGSARPS